MSEAPEKRSESISTANSPDEGLPSLFSRLGDDLGTLLELRLNLLKVEIREDVDAYIRRGITMVIGGMVVAVGFALANLALSFFISTLFANLQMSQPVKYGLGFMTTGIVYLVVGAVIIVVTRKRLAAQDLLPRRSLNEFEHDKELVKSVIQG
ncbi:MAG: putative Actinobacterial Holin-X, holin superfamily [Blastocatellia bacterium]|jgi:uncharacterized membrane protein YqjE|nr:putative Actinobacterial Holin-X, holin superfamily [Blastocatellia bacterium]